MKQKGMTKSYKEFLEEKAMVHVSTGILNPKKIHGRLFGFQGDLTRWALIKGRAGLFEATGSGKTIQELEYSRHVELHTKRPVLILAPLSVTHQTQQEAIKHLELETCIAADDSDVKDRGIYLTNYAKLHKFDPDKFSGVVLDEASILKGFDRSTASRLIEMFAKTPFRLVCTATPAPNDIQEIGSYSEFLGVMTMSEMLSTFFVHDGGETQKWRLKGHAEQEFWKWMASWSACINKPSDIGYSNEGYDLPKLHMHEVIVEGGMVSDGELFTFEAKTLTERRGARRASIGKRVQAAADLVNDSAEQFVIWCNLNSEGDALEEVIPGSVQVSGSDSDEKKEQAIADFLSGKIRVLISKVVIFGFGLNLQRCHNTIFVGLSDSFEQFYQAIRRFWRFGQKEEVHAWIIISDSEGAVLKNIKRKERDAVAMQQNLVGHMAELTKGQLKGSARQTLAYNPSKAMSIPKWLSSSI